MKNRIRVCMYICVCGIGNLRKKKKKKVEGIKALLCSEPQSLRASDHRSAALLFFSSFSPVCLRVASLILFFKILIISL